MIIYEKCHRADLLKVLEEPGHCLRCDSCSFLKKLKNALQEMKFLCSNSHIQRWEIIYKYQIMTAKPIIFSFS